MLISHMHLHGPIQVVQWCPQFQGTMSACVVYIRIWLENHVWIFESHWFSWYWCDSSFTLATIDTLLLIFTIFCAPSIHRNWPARSTVTVCCLYPRKLNQCHIYTTIECIIIAVVDLFLARLLKLTVQKMKLSLYESVTGCPLLTNKWEGNELVNKPQQVCLAHCSAHTSVCSGWNSFRQT